MQVAKEEIEKIPEIDLALKTNEKTKVVEKVEEYLNNLYKPEDTEIKEYTDFGNVTYTEKTRAVIKVQDGCDNFCSYCIIPYARGRVRSRKPENVISEITDIASKGIKEVVITGIHETSYGKDFENGYSLIDLLEDIQKIDGVERIRLGSVEPTWITIDVLKRLSKLSKMCHHFHLSLQSGCTDTLKRMNRKYTAEEFEKTAEMIRDFFDDSILTTDIIVRISSGKLKKNLVKHMNF